MSKHLIALCVGHSRLINGRAEGGAVSVGGMSEHTYNIDLAARVQALLSQEGIASIIISRYEGNGYSAAQAWLAGILRDKGVTAAVELHFNCADSASANGHEWLHWHSSSRGELLAKRLASAFSALPLKARGAKPLTPSDRGAEFVKGTHCPAVICEPFFGSNADDWKFAVDRKDELARRIAQGIKEYTLTV